jgi:hypothetical protein
MKTLLLTTPQGQIETGFLDEFISAKPTEWHIEVSPSGSLGQLSISPDITIVQLNDETRPAEVKTIIPRLAQLQAKSGQGSYVMFALRRMARLALAKAKARQKRIDDILNEIYKRLKEFPNPERVDVSVEGSELKAKLNLIEAKIETAPPRTSPLDRIKEVAESAQDLRAPSGNISAERVATLYGVSVSQLAAWLGRSRQAVTKTPDADSLQPGLSFFERVARLRLVLKNDAAFRKWLRTPQKSLHEASPLALMAKGQGQVITDLVEDMLTGAPT